MQQLDESFGLARVPQHAEEIGDVVVQVIVDLGICPRLLQQHASRAAEWLDVAAVRGEVLKHPGRQPELGAVIAQCGGCDLWHECKKPERRLLNGLWEVRIHRS